MRPDGAGWRVTLTRVLHWFRADLRLRDNLALAAACRRADELALCFVFDEGLLAAPTMGAPRLRFLLDCLDRLRRDLQGRGHKLLLRRGSVVDEMAGLLDDVKPEVVSWNRDTTPYARQRDLRVGREAEQRGVEVLTAKDRVVFEAPELLTKTGESFRVYTPYRRAWEARFEAAPPAIEAVPRFPAALRKRVSSIAFPNAKALGFPDESAKLPSGGEAAAQRRLRAFIGRALRDYDTRRDRPDMDGSSRLSPYLRFGAISVRTCVHAARDAALADRKLSDGAERWVSELIWRDFYAAILEQHPRVLAESFRPEYDRLEWDDAPEHFAAWCAGQTGFPIVDAGMRQLVATGWMHNRVRMIVASFLTKDLLIDWRRGEQFFLSRLVDADPASNNGGWQWSASTGTDAQPYFRIFNPTSQAKRFDPEGDYVRRWVSELRVVAGAAVHEPGKAGVPSHVYPRPIVDHAVARKRALASYKRAARRSLPSER